jgi:hypothetical protein
MHKLFEAMAVEAALLSITVDLRQNVLRNGDVDALNPDAPGGRRRHQHRNSRPVALVLQQHVEGGGLGNGETLIAHQPDMAGKRLGAHGGRLLERRAGADASGEVRERDTEVAVLVLVDQGDVVPHRLTSISGRQFVDRLAARCS